MPDYPDLPPVSEDPNQPLPDVASDSELVPYRIGRKDPGGEYQYTTGYAPRGRPAIALPQGMGFSGAGVPDLSGLISEAFQRLPVDEALKMSEFATKYIAQRGYMADINAGKDAAVSFAKWAPVGLFKVPTGIPEAINRSVPTPITPQQMVVNRLNQAKFQAAQEAAKAKAAAPKLHFGASGEIIREKPGGEFEVARPATTKETTESPDVKAERTDAYKELDEARRDLRKLDEKFPPGTDPEKENQVFAAGKRLFDARQRVSRLKNPAAPLPVNAAQPLAEPPQLKPLTKEAVQMFKRQAGGDKEKARKLAKDAGYQL